MCDSLQGIQPMPMRQPSLEVDLEEQVNQSDDISQKILDEVRGVRDEQKCMYVYVRGGQENVTAYLQAGRIQEAN